MPLASGVLLAAKRHKKKKKKSGILGFLGNAFKTVLDIAPNIIHSFANNAHPNWVQGPYTKTKLLAMAAKAGPRPFVEGQPAPQPQPGLVLMSRANYERLPTVVKSIEGLGHKVVPMPNAAMAPVSYGAHQRYNFSVSGATHKKFGQGIRVRGTDYLDDVLGTAAQRGTILQQLDLNPGRWDGSRVARYASMYERFVVNSLSVVYTPCCPTSTQGAVVLWFDYDPNDQSGQSRDTIVRAIGSFGQDNGPVWASCCAHFSRDPEQPDYYVDSDGSDDRFTSAGTFYAAVMSQLDAGVSGAFGTLMLVYDISFFVPSIQQTIPGPAPEYLISTGATSGATTANPLGTNYVVDADNTLDLLKVAGSTTFYGFQGVVGMPQRYFFVAYAANTAGGITAINWGVGTGVTSIFTTFSIDGTAPGGTKAMRIGTIEVAVAPETDPSTATVLFSTTGAAPDANAGSFSVRFFRVPVGVGLKKLTLQNYEAKTIALEDKVSKLLDVLAERGVRLDNDVRPVPARVVLTPLSSTALASPTLSRYEKGKMACECSHSE